MTLLWFWKHRDSLDYSLNKLYRACQISKQSFHEWLQVSRADMGYQQQLLPLIRQVRQDHPQMSARVMYQLIQPQRMGRDKFIRFCMTHGFKVGVKKNAMRTTDSRNTIRFPNLVKDIVPTHENQVWVSDITYYRLNEQFCYITFIMDAKSKFITAAHVSRELSTEETTLMALKQALAKYRPPEGLIFHSDGGGQYYCDKFTQLTQAYKILNSMTESNGENNHAERINHTIKNTYVKWYMPTTFKQLAEMVEKAVYNYNYKRPHQSLYYRTPAHMYGLSTEKQVLNKEKRSKKESNMNSYLLLK